MQKGISKYWTPDREAQVQRLIDGSHNFAEQSLLMALRDILKYDQRTKAGKRAEAQARLRLATATDEDLEEMAKLMGTLQGAKDAGAVEEELEKLKKGRARVRKKGIKRSELECH